MRKWADKYKLRLERKALLFRAFRQMRRMDVVSSNTSMIADNDILCVADCPDDNQLAREFLDYYQAMGIDRFLLLSCKEPVPQLLITHPLVSIWRTDDHASGLNALLRKFGRGHWCLTLNSNDRFVYPHMDRRPIRALTDWLTASNTSSFGALQVDTYDHKKEVYFDAGNFLYSRESKYQNLIVHGGVRQRVEFNDAPENAPNLARIPLVHWATRSTYVSASALLPRSLNNVYTTNGGQGACGALLTPSGIENSWTPNSCKYNDWQQLEQLHIISKGQWA